VSIGPAAPPRAGEWLYTTRPGAERHLIEELAFTEPRSAPHLVAPALVAAARPSGELAFARQGFPLGALLRGAPDQVAQLAAGAARALADLLAARRSTKGEHAWAFDAWVPDDDAANPLASRAARLEREVLTTLERIDPAAAALRVAGAPDALKDNGLYAQACLYDGGAACAVGVSPARDAPSLAPGGRLRVHVPDAAPSRAAMKLLEAFAWLDRAPEPGDVCVDLGAAPGGWSWVLLQRRAKVIAVDPAKLAPSLRGARGLDHIPADAFHFDPGEPVDWLFSDMAWRPLEAAALLAKWARRGWARLLIANIKLPMNKKAEHLLRVRDILTDGGWQHLRARQLYHDRDEVTVAGVRI
jgi:23S rRNA (cytidine2498-2'-O)-methyltransferase